MSGTVLIVTALEDVTADMVIKALNRRGHRWCVWTRPTSGRSCTSR